MSNELTAAFKRTGWLGSEYVDRKGWTKKQWADDAQRIMSHIDGAVSALKNGHINGLLARIRELTPRTIETVEELDALPEGAVIRDGNDYVAERRGDGLWGCTNEERYYSVSMTLPATVLYEPAP